MQRRRGFAAETERALLEVTQRLGEALPEEDAPDDAWLGAVDRLTGLRDWGGSMLCRLRSAKSGWQLCSHVMGLSYHDFGFV